MQMETIQPPTPWLDSPRPASNPCMQLNIPPAALPLVPATQPHCTAQPPPRLEGGEEQPTPLLKSSPHLQARHNKEITLQCCPTVKRKQSTQSSPFTPSPRQPHSAAAGMELKVRCSGLLPPCTLPRSIMHILSGPHY